MNHNEDWTETEMTMTTEDYNFKADNISSEESAQNQTSFGDKILNSLNQFFSYEESAHNETSPGDKILDSLTQFLPAWILLFSLIILACVCLWGRSGRKKSSYTIGRVVSRQDRYGI